MEEKIKMNVDKLFLVLIMKKIFRYILLKLNFFSISKPKLSHALKAVWQGLTSPNVFERFLDKIIILTNFSEKTVMRCIFLHCYLLRKVHSN